MLAVTRTHFFIARSAPSAADLCHSLCRPSEVGSLTGHRCNVPNYFDNYARLEDWHLIPGLVHGRPAGLVRNPSDPTGKPAYFILVQWEGDRVANIRDFRFARYATEGAELLIQ